MGTPVISLHRWSTPVADCFHHYGGKKGAFMVPEANSSDRQHWFTWSKRMFSENWNKNKQNTKLGKTRWQTGVLIFPAFILKTKNSSFHNSFNCFRFLLVSVCMGAFTSWLRSRSVLVTKKTQTMMQLCVLIRPTGNRETITRSHNKPSLGNRGNDAWCPLTTSMTSTHTRTQVPLSFRPASGFLSRPHGQRQHGAELSGERYGDIFMAAPSSRGTLPGVVAQVIHYDVTSEEEMKRSPAPCASCLCRLVTARGG